jgi:hypothetical protein
MNDINIYYNDDGEVVGLSGIARSKKEALAQFAELRRLGVE